MITRTSNFLLSCQWSLLALVFLIRSRLIFGLNSDGTLLLSFKQTILSDPFGVLQTWNGHDDNPCSWNGVTCGVSGSSDAYFRVTSLSLPGYGLLGQMSPTLGMIEHIRNINLSDNLFNGSIPDSMFSAYELEILDFSNNLISGEIPGTIGNLKNLQVVNLSENALTGNLPGSLTSLRNLTMVSLNNNYLYGPIPEGGFDSVRVMDLSSNLLDGSLPRDFGGSNLALLNVSFNRLSGEISDVFASKIPSNATIDLSYNNLTGRIPESNVLLNQATASYKGNPGLCGTPLSSICPIPSSIATVPNATVSSDLHPAIAAMPETAAGKRTGMRTGTILGIVIGDVVGIGLVAAIFVYIYNRRKRENREKKIKGEAESAKEFNWASPESSSSLEEEEEYSWLRAWRCLRKPRGATEDESDDDQEMQAPREKKTGALVLVDGERELELESLLTASAYVLGASGTSIVYKAVLEDGTTVAVRRIGENGAERFRDFKNQIGVIAKLVHPNLVRIRGFYWGIDEKLIIYDFVPNGSLANARQRKAGSSPCHLPWEMRLKIAKGVARGLCYIHEKKHVHGNLKPNNILLGLDMEPKIGDFGLERLVMGDYSSSKAGGSARNFSSMRSTASRDSLQDFSIGPTLGQSPSVLNPTPYHAPESLRSLKPNPKWDVFSFGVVLLELLTGKVIVSDESGPGLAIGTSTWADEDKGKVLRIADVGIRADVEGKEDALLALIKLGYGCISPLPQKRPSMKEVLQALEKFPASSFSSPYHQVILY